MQKNFYLLFVYITGLFYGCQTSPDEIAQVGELVISVDELRSALRDRYPHMVDFENLAQDKKLDVLNYLIERKLKLNAAYEQALDKEPEIRDNIQNYESKLITGRYHEKVVIDQLVPRQEVEKYIQNQRYEVKTSQILITYVDVNPKYDRSMDEAKKLAEEIYQKLIQGADFTKMVEQYSDDPSAGQNKGSLPYVTWGSLVPEYEEAAWSMNTGDISKPVKTKFGFHIIRLDEKRVRSDYKEPDDNKDIFYIKQRLFMSLRDSGAVAWQKQIEHLKDYYKFQLEKQNILSIATIITQKVYNGITDFYSFDEAQLKLVLATWTGGSYTVRDLLTGDAGRWNRLLMRYKQAQFIEEDVEAKCIQHLIRTDAEQLGIDDDPYLNTLVQNFLENQLLQRIEKIMISNKAEPTDEEALKYYKVNTDKFMKPAEIELWEIFVTNEDLAKSLAVRVRNGENFERLAQKYSKDKRYQAQNGYIGFITLGARGDISREAFSIGPGIKIGGPLKYRDGWVIFKTGRKKDASLRPYAEVDNRARSLLKGERINKLRVSWEDSLKYTYRVDIDTTKLSEL